MEAANSTATTYTKVYTYSNNYFINHERPKLEITAKWSALYDAYGKYVRFVLSLRPPTNAKMQTVHLYLHPCPKESRPKS